MLHPLLVLNLHENNHNFSKASFNWKGNLCNTNHCKFAILNRCSSTSIVLHRIHPDKIKDLHIAWDDYIGQSLTFYLRIFYCLLANPDSIMLLQKALLLVNQQLREFPKTTFPMAGIHARTCSAETINKYQPIC